MQKIEKQMDDRGRIVIPKQFIDKIGIKLPENVSVMQTDDNKIIIEKIKEIQNE